MSKTVFSKIFDILVTVAVCLAVIVALLWFVHTFNVFELPEFIDSFFASDTPDTEKKDAFEENLLQLLESENYTEGEYEYITLTSDKALQLLTSIDVVSDYFWKVETIVEYDGSARTQIHNIYKQGDKIRFDTKDDLSDFTTIIFESKTVTKNNLTGEIVEFGGDTEFSYTNLINIAAIEQILDSDKLNVKNIAVVDFENEKYLYVEIPKSDINGVDKYFVSLDYGIIMYATSEINGKEYFSQRTVQFDRNSTISSSAFEITDLTE